MYRCGAATPWQLQLHACRARFLPYHTPPPCPFRSARPAGQAVRLEQACLKKWTRAQPRPAHTHVCHTLVVRMRSYGTAFAEAACSSQQQLARLPPCRTGCPARSCMCASFFTTLHPHRIAALTVPVPPTRAPLAVVAGIPWSCLGMNGTASACKEGISRQYACSLARLLFLCTVADGLSTAQSAPPRARTCRCCSSGIARGPMLLAQGVPWVGCRIATATASAHPSLPPLIATYVCSQ